LNGVAWVKGVVGIKWYLLVVNLEVGTPNVLTTLVLPPYLLILLLGLLQVYLFAGGDRLYPDSGSLFARCYVQAHGIGSIIETIISLIGFTWLAELKHSILIRAHS